MSLRQRIDSLCAVCCYSIVTVISLAVTAEFIKKVMAGPSEKWGVCFHLSQPTSSDYNADSLCALNHSTLMFLTHSLIHIFVRRPDFPNWTDDNMSFCTATRWWHTSTLSEKAFLTTIPAVLYTRLPFDRLIIFRSRSTTYDSYSYGVCCIWSACKQL